MKPSFWLPLAGALLATGCATPVPPSEPSAMVPAMLRATIPAGTNIYVDRVRLGSAAAAGKTPFEELTGQFPLVQPQGLANYQESIRLSLAAAGMQSPVNPATTRYALRPVLLGGMAIPFREGYSLLFVHYELEDGKTGKIVWSRTVYSQAKLENVGPAMQNTGKPDPAYTRLAAANLRQMVTALSEWLTLEHNAISNGRVQ